MRDHSAPSSVCNAGSLVGRFQQRDRRALARLLTLAAHGEDQSLLRAAIAAGEAESSGRVIAITGSAGVGKSSLIGKLIEHFRSKDESVAVLACDPQSPLTGGALLGDRFRMPSRPEDSGVFIRSLATASGHGAVAEHLEQMIDVLKAFGFAWILVETVGAGQGDTAVHGLADVVVLLLQPEAGDDIQWEKAGLLEIADVVVIHKADLPGAERVEAQVRAMLNLPGVREVPIVRVSAAKGTGLQELAALLIQPPSRGRKGGRARSLLQLAEQELRLRFERPPSPQLAELQECWSRGEVTDAEAARAALQLLASWK